MKFTKTILASVLMMATFAHANTPSDVGVDDGLDLTVLESEPNTLYGIDGLHQGRVPLNAISPNTLKTFVSVVDLIRREYVSDINDEQLFEYAMSGMLTGLDRHAEFLDKTAFSNLQSFTAGNIAGVGLSAEWQKDHNHWVVKEVENNTPAKNAGVSVGDYLHQIGDVKLTESHTDNDIVQMLRGIAGTQVDVVHSKAGRSKRTANLQRTQVMKSSIETVIYDGVAVIKLPIFQNNTRAQIMSSLSQTSTPIVGVVLDIRNNPGGVLESARDVVSLFVRGQQVAQVVGREGLERVIQTEGSPELSALPLIVLQNRHSASAAEVLASSLKAQKRALIVGETSYGKGSVQSVIPLGDGQAVKMTTAHYLTANGKQIDGVGVVPDVVFSTTPIDSTSADGLVVYEDWLKDDWLKQTLALMDAGKLPEGVRFDGND